MKIKTISLDRIKPPRLQPRLDENDPGLQELAASIKRHGLISPLTVVAEGDGYRLLAGNRRLKALQMVGATTAPCVVVKAADDLQDEITMAENLIRKNLSPVEEAYAFALYLDATGATQEELADRLGKERTYVTRRLMLLDLDDATLGAIEEGILTLSEALLLRQVDDLEMRQRFIEHAAKYGCTTTVMEYWVRDYQRQKAEMERQQQREITAAEVTIPREVLMRCEHCGNPTPYSDLQTVYICRSCYRQVVAARLVETGSVT